jgi:hypothetical protein
MEVDARVLVISLTVENEFLSSENAIKHICEP